MTRNLEEYAAEVAAAAQKPFTVSSNGNSFGTRAITGHTNNSDPKNHATSCNPDNFVYDR